MDARLLEMALVYPSANGRPVVGAQVERLAESLSIIGLRQPITVTPCRKFRNGIEIDAFEVVAGRHRYEAAVKLKWTEIDAFIMDGDADDAALWEIDENFARAELTDAQRAKHHVRREDILKRKGLVKDAPKGGRPKNSEKSSELPSYAEHAAASLGVTDRTVRQDLARGKKIAPDVLAEVAGTDLDKGVVLDELARTPRESQAAKVAEIRDRQEAEKLNRYADKAVARTNAEEAAEIVHANLDLDQVDALAARLSSVSMKDFLSALSKRRHA